MEKYVCNVCGYVYDPAVGDPDNGIAPGTKFEDLPEVCREYINRLEELCECRIKMVGVGPDREQMIER